MKTKQDIIDEGIKRLEKLKQETILRYTDEIEFDQDLSLYDVMINHFVNGDLDDVFDASVTKGMSDKEKNDLFDLTREFVGLCFSNGDVDYWLDSLENTPIFDYSLIAYSIFNSYDFLLHLAKEGGRDALELLVSLRASEDLRDTALVNYLKNTFVDDKVLSSVLLDMSKKDSFYNIFTDEQKGILLNYPEGTLYAYGENDIRITYPLVLGVEIYNNVNSDDPITEINESDLEPLLLTLSEFFREGEFEFYDEVLTLVDKYRDYVRKNEITLSTEVSSVKFDTESELIQEAWSVGDEMLGSTFDTPYTGGSK
ncbi:MAG: hypothetical protein IJO63_00145 [Bacilli bacterium]|nr:hypothetical protein [Bacilli bacterium]